MDVLLSLSNEYAYFRDRGPVRLADLGHEPWFWAMPRKGEDAAAARRRLVSAWQESGGPAGAGDDGGQALRKILKVGELDTVKSFVNHGTSRPAFPVYATRSYFVPEISDELFLRHGFYTAEHDVPYQQRACADLAASGKAWPFDTGGQKEKLKVLVYDIETTQFSGGAKKVPVDMIGWSEFEITYQASHDLDREEFHFDLLDSGARWQDCEVQQLEAATPDQEIDNLLKFVRRIPNYHVVSGHNILAFDNKEIFDRIKFLLEQDERNRTLSSGAKRAFEEFAGRGRDNGKWAARDRTFSFGQSNETVNFYPTSFDTYHAARRFYFFLEEFTLKKVAPFLGIVVPDRLILSPHDLKINDPRTRLYNKHDVLEQLGITSLLLAQAMPLAFTAGWTFEEALTGGNVRIWDHMAMVRAARQKKIMAATCRAQGIARTVLTNLGTRPTKEQIVEDAKRRMMDASPPSWLKEYVRVAKYGDEMPDWVELPHVIVNPKAISKPDAATNGDAEAAEDAAEEELQGYAIPGGMTLHPQTVGSHFIPWWHVVDADVGAMYPTILRARNVGPDTVRLARKGETPDDWVFLYRIPDEFRKDDRFLFREIGPEENFAKPGEGVMVGVRITPEAGLVPSAMKGIMGIATKVKKTLGAAKKNPGVSKTELDRLTMTYASIKALRNAGTHGQMLAVNVSCRGFNLWAGAEITTVGQKILADSMAELNAKNARVLYSDTDGLYIGCSRSGRNLMHVAEALAEEFDPKESAWLIHPDKAIEAIQELNVKWRKYLGYEDFELEAGHHDAMVFVVHKNYLIFDVKGGKLRMTTKGNNFKGSDKAPVAQKALEDIMLRSLKDNIEWTDEEAARKSMRASIAKWTQEAIKGLDPSKFAREDLTLVQLVQPPGAYATAGLPRNLVGPSHVFSAMNAGWSFKELLIAEKGVRGGLPAMPGSLGPTLEEIEERAAEVGVASSLVALPALDAKAQPEQHQGVFAVALAPSVWTKRATALEKVLGEKLRAPKKIRFVVCKKPLPGIDKPSAKGLKPLDFMWPLDAIEDPQWKGQAEIDLGWYRDMIAKYVRGAFGLEERELTPQKGLDSWM